MHDIDEIINEATDAREVKRAVSVKMGAARVQSGTDLPGAECLAAVCEQVERPV